MADGGAQVGVETSDEESEGRFADSQPGKEYSTQFDGEDDEAEDAAGEEEDAVLAKVQAARGPVKSYDMRAKESQFSRFNEEWAYLNSRKMRLGNMDAKEKHLYLFTNFDQLNQTDINKSQEVKVWAVLYHFRNKSQDSQIFEEFTSTVSRNCLNKVKGHELFNQFHSQLVREGRRSGCKVVLSTSCPVSGWPIDIVVTRKAQDRRTQYYFFLQEEMCYNIEDNRE